ncbi:MAG: hypothetical protein HPAVJP_2230 [Candidatus Hepatoplasma vulgare]|nr:MAG: hypothetical protein HPAVJP_2230 [Candidatus Hepatoplasma sp.]
MFGKFNVVPYSRNPIQIKQDLENKWLDLNPKYQRGYVWSKRFQRELIISIFSGYPIGTVVVRGQSKTRNLELVDGQQRIKTIIRFMDDELTLNSTHSVKAKEILNLRGENYDKYQKNIYKFSNLTLRDQSDFKNSFLISGFQIQYDNDEEVKNYFDKIQTQEKLLAGELINNLPNNIFDEIFEENENNIDNFCKFIGFNNNRKNFQKALFNSIGFNLEYIELGIIDDKLIKFVNDLSSKEMRKNLKYDEVLFKEKIKESLFQILKLNKNIDINKKAKQRFLKLLFLLINYLNMNDSINFERLALINRNLSEYNTKYARKNENKFIENLITDGIISNQNDFHLFEDLYDLFYKTQKNDNEVKALLKYWSNEIKQNSYLESLNDFNAIQKDLN